MTRPSMPLTPQEQRANQPYYDLETGALTYQRSDPRQLELMERRAAARQTPAHGRPATELTYSGFAIVEGKQ